MKTHTRTPLFYYFLALFSGFLLFLATPYVGYWFIAPVALVPFFVSHFSLTSKRRRSLATLLMAIPYCTAEGEPLFRLAGTWWVGSGGGGIGASALYVGGIVLIIVVASVCYIVPALFAERLFRRMPPAIALGVGFALIESFRSSILLAGYSWGAMGYLLIDTLYIKHFAAVFGVYGLTFLMVTWSAWSAQLLKRMYENKGNFLARFREALFSKLFFFESVTLSMLVCATLLFGAERELRTPDLGIPMRVAVIASQIRTEESIAQGSYRAYRTLFLDALKQEPDIILTPENVFPYFILDEDTGTLTLHPSVYLANAGELYLDFLALTQSAPRVTFATALHSHEGGKLYNSIVLYRDGRILSVYHKRKPVPFTEYAPLGIDLPLFQRFAKGPDLQDFRLDTLLLGGYVCSEIGITPLSVHGAKLILSPSNDSALLSTTIMPLHHQFARMRALEAGAYMIRSSKGGISSIIDPYGRAIATMSGTTGVLVADIR